jgi:hypothetical protein
MFTSTPTTFYFESPRTVKIKSLSKKEKEHSIRISLFAVTYFKQGNKLEEVRTMDVSKRITMGHPPTISRK